MVTRHGRRAGAVLSHLALRALRDDCLILRAAQAPRAQREYQAVIGVDPVNFSLLASEEQVRILEGYRAFLAGRTPADGTLCIHARTSRYDLTPYLEQLEHTARTHREPGYRQMAVSHRQFVEQLAASRVLLTRGFWVRVSVVLPLRARHARQLTDDDHFAQARTALERSVESTIAGLNQAGLLSRRLRAQELVTYYQSCVHSHSPTCAPLPAEVLETLEFPPRADVPAAPAPEQRALLLPAAPADAPVSGDDQACSHERWWRGRRRRPASERAPFPARVCLPELLQPSSLEEEPHCIRVHHQRDEYVRARAVIGYPARVYPGWLDQLLAIEEPEIDLLLFLRALDPARYVRSLGRRLTGYRATQLVEARHGRTENPYIEAARAEVEQLRESLVARTEQVFAVSLYTLARAETRQGVRERDHTVARLLTDLEMPSVPLQFEHLPAYLSCVDARDTLQRARVLPTSVVACLFPFCSTHVSTEPGALVGMTPTDGLIFLNPTSDHLENGHVLTLGQSGAGKSLGEKLALMRNLLIGQRAVVIDPDDEYGKIGSQFGGTRVTLGPENLRINPFDLRTAAGERAGLNEKLASLLVLFDLLLADTDAGMLRQAEKGALHTLLTRAYAERGITVNPRTHTRPVPCMQDVFRLIGESGDPHGLGERLARYVACFPATTDVDLANQLVIFTIKHLKDTSEELLRAGLYLVADHVWEVMRSLRTPEPRLLLIDEAWTLLAFPEGGRFLEHLSRRGRKYNLHVRLVTQHVNDFLETRAGQAILLNSATKILLRHDETALETLTRAFTLSEGERRYLAAAGKGQGLLFCRSSHTAFYALPGPDEYRLATTNMNEVLLEERRDQAQREEDAVLAEQEARAVEAGAPVLFSPDEEGAR